MEYIGSGRRVRVLLMVAVTLAAATHAAADAHCKFKRVGTIPVEWKADRLTLDGSINDTPLQMVVDTGAQQTVISGALAERLKLSLIHVNNVQVGFGGRSEESMSRLDELSLGRFQWHRAKVGVVWEAKNLPDVLVGAPMLFERDLELTDKQLAFYTATDCEDAPLGYWADDVPWLPMLAPTPQDVRVNVIVEVDGQPLRALVDTGAPSSLLDSVVARRLGFDPDDPSAHVGSSGGIGGHVNAVSVMTLDTVAIGPEVIRRARIRVADLWGSAERDVRRSEAGDLFVDVPRMILGADFIRSHRLLFAGSQRRLYFTYLGGDVFQAPAPARPASAAAP